MRLQNQLILGFTGGALLALSTSAADHGTQLADPLVPLLDPTVLAADFARTYRVDTNSPAVLFAPDGSGATPQEALRLFLMARGLDLSEASRTKLFYNDRTGILTVRGSLRDLDAIETALAELAITPPQVTVRATIVEIGGTDVDEEIKQLLRLEDTDTGQPTVGVLTETQTRIVLRALEQKPGVDMFTATPVTTLSGRQARLLLQEAPPTLTDPPFTAPGKSPKARWSTKPPN